MKKIVKDESGNVLVMTAAGLMVVMGFAAFVVDLGCIMTARNQLQNAADAAALAGASGLLSSTTRAVDQAIYYAGRNDCLNQPVQISSANVTFPTSGRVRVQTTRDIPLFFSHVFGIGQVTITGDATAGLSALHGTKGLRPFAMPKSDWAVGEQMVIKPGNNGATGTPSFYHPVDFPPVNRGTPETGGSVYEDNISYGSRHYVSVGDVLQIEPGDKVGPTSQGIKSLIEADANAYWDGQKVSGSAFPDYASPRVIKIALYDPAYPPDSGRNNITCIGLAAFFVERMSGNDVIGRFIETVTTGDYGGGYSLLYQVKLMQ